MREINFFRQITKSKKNTQRKWFMTALIPTVLIAIILLAFGAIRMAAWKVNSDSDHKKEYLNSEEVAKDRAEYEEKKTKLDIINKYNTSLDSINGSLAAIDMINTDMMHKLQAALPQDTVFKSLTITSRSIKISGVCGSRVTAAELLHNLSAVDVLENVKITSLTKQPTGVSQTFNVDANLKGGIKK